MSITWAVWIIAITGIVGLLVLIHIMNLLGHLCGHGEDSLRRMVADIRRELAVRESWKRGEPADPITAMGAAYAGMHGEEWEEDA